MKNENTKKQNAMSTSINGIRYQHACGKYTLVAEKSRTYLCAGPSSHSIAEWAGENGCMIVDDRVTTDQIPGGLHQASESTARRAYNQAVALESAAHFNWGYASAILAQSWGTPQEDSAKAQLAIALGELEGASKRTLRALLDLASR